MSAPDAIDQSLVREFFGGPCDGDKRLANGRVLVRVAGDASNPVHEYAQSHRGMEWLGVVNDAGNRRVHAVRPGIDR